MIDSQRIAEKVMEAHNTGDLTGLMNWLEKLGCKDIEEGKESITVTGLTGMRVGFILGDPVTLAVCTGFALFGPHWAFVCPELLEKVKKLWNAQRKKLKGG